MKSILFIALSLYAAVFCVNGQELNVDQTLAYINKQLNDPLNKVKEIKIHTFVPEGTVTTSNVERIFMDDYKLSGKNRTRISYGVANIFKKVRNKDF